MTVAATLDAIAGGRTEPGQNRMQATTPGAGKDTAWFGTAFADALPADKPQESFTPGWQPRNAPTTAASTPTTTSSTISTTISTRTAVNTAVEETPAGTRQALVCRSSPAAHAADVGSSTLWSNSSGQNQWAAESSSSPENLLAVETKSATQPVVDQATLGESRHTGADSSLRSLQNPPAAAEATEEVAQPISRQTSRSVAQMPAQPDLQANAHSIAQPDAQSLVRHLAQPSAQAATTAAGDIETSFGRATQTVKAAPAGARFAMDVSTPVASARGASNLRNISESVVETNSESLKASIPAAISGGLGQASIPSSVANNLPSEVPVPFSGQAAVALPGAQPALPQEQSAGGAELQSGSGEIASAGASTEASTPGASHAAPAERAVKHNRASAASQPQSAHRLANADSSSGSGAVSSGSVSGWAQQLAPAQPALPQAFPAPIQTAAPVQMQSLSAEAAQSQHSVARLQAEAPAQPQSSSADPAAQWSRSSEGARPMDGTERTGASNRIANTVGLAEGSGQVLPVLETANTENGAASPALSTVQNTAQNWSGTGGHNGTGVQAAPVLPSGAGGQTVSIDSTAADQVERSGVPLRLIDSYDTGAERPSLQPLNPRTADMGIESAEALRQFPSRTSPQTAAKPVTESSTQLQTPVSTQTQTQVLTQAVRAGSAHSAPSHFGGLADGAAGLHTAGNSSQLSATDYAPTASLRGSEMSSLSPSTETHATEPQPAAAAIDSAIATQSSSSVADTAAVQAMAGAEQSAGVDLAETSATQSAPPNAARAALGTAGKVSGTAAEHSRRTVGPGALAEPGAHAAPAQVAGPPGDAAGLLRNPSAAHEAIGAVGTDAGAQGGSAKAAAAHDAFAALDADTGFGTPSLTHAGPRQAEGGFQDPDLGWVGVRADASGGQVHATLTAGSTEAAQALGGHMTGLNAYLAEQRSPVETVTVASPAGKGVDSGANQGMSQGSSQGSDQGSNRGSNQGLSQETGQQGFSQPGVGSRPVAASFAGAQTPDVGRAPGGDVPGGTHISLMA